MKDSPPITRESAEWTRCKSWLLFRIHKLQRDLEAPSLGERESDTIRGRIAAYREFMLAVEPQKRIDTDDTPVDRTIDY
jgi:hypothetical protein